METADYMLQGGRHFYSVFMCHLAIEKALKGFYRHKLEESPPKTHNLIYLLNKTGVKPAETMGFFITKLNEANITTRYPEDIDALKSNYTQDVTEQILAQTKELLSWIKKQF